jgi:hypothetical protein
VKRRIYIDPECSLLEDCSARPYSWDSSRCVVLRDDALWQLYLDAERACEEARQAVLAAATDEPLTDEECALHARVAELHSTPGINSGEWLRRNDEIEAEARRLAERDAPAGDEGVSP